MASAISVSSSSDSQNENYTSWSYGKLEQLVDTTLKANAILKMETEIFQNYYKNVEDIVDRSDTAPSKATASLSIGDGSSTMSNGSYAQIPPSLRVRSARQYNRSAGRHFERLVRLKAEDKCEIAIKEIECLKEERRKRATETEKIVSHLKAIIEEAVGRLADLKREEYEFERDITKGGISSRTGKVCAEKVVRYFDARLKAKDNYISKLRLKSQGLRQQRRKMQTILRQKEEIGDVLTEIDFQQLQIENSDRIEQIEERNKDFFRLKTNGTVTVHVLNHFKKKLNRIMMESSQLKQDISSRQLMLSRIDAETKQCEAERVKAATLNTRKRQIMSHYKVPSVMDAVKLGSEVEALTSKVLIWERKRNIAEMAYAAQKNRWSKLKFEVDSAAGAPKVSF